MEFCWELVFVRGDDDEEEREEAVSGVVGAADAHSAGEECCSKSELSQQQLCGNPSGRTTGGCCAVVFELQTALHGTATARLLGFSLGCQLAYHIAVDFQAASIPTQLVLLDGGAPNTTVDGVR